MENFAFRGLALNNNRMWKWESVRRALDFVQRFDMTALIFHQRDLIDKVVLPSKYFTEEETWAHWSIRFCAVSTAGQYLRRVLRATKVRGIDFYLEVGEISYPEELLDKCPNLRTADGHICPTDPFWFAFLRDKVEELLCLFPDIAGVIVSPAARDAKVSLAANRCACERCRGTTEEAWYARYLEALHEPLNARGKRLVACDISCSSGAQNALLDAARAVSDDLVIGLKNVPHGLLPAYPSKPGVAHRNRAWKWIEYDAWGQHRGLGVLPCGSVNEIATRFAHSLRHGCDGVWLRTDWEMLDEVSIFNSFNVVNLIAAAMLAKDPLTPYENICRAWLEYGLFSSFREESTMQKPARPTAPTAQENLSLFMEAAWEALRKSLYVFGHVFSDSSRYQRAYRSIYNVMNVYQQRAQWDPGSARDIVPTEENLQRIFAEKRQAVDEAKALGRLVKVNRLGLPETFAAEIRDILSLYPYYCEGFEWSARAYFRLHKAITEKSPADARLAEKENEGLKAFVVRLKTRLQNTYYPFYVYWMMDSGELEALAQDVDRLAGAIR